MKDIEKKARPDKHCIDCGIALMHRRGPVTRCFDCAKEKEKERESIRRNRYSKERLGAISAVQSAVKQGLLQRLSGPVKIKCADCGQPATCWDHRDYAKPLDVDPVCKSCNRQRGTGANAWKRRHLK